MATIHDVALDAGVSPTTVSRYLNNRIDLPAATAARIDAAIKRLNYRPNLLAKRLSTGKSEAISLVVPEIGESFFAQLASAVEDEADRHGYTILMSSSESNREREIASLNRLHDRHVDGLILMTNTLDDGTLAGLIGRRRNVVLVDEDIPGVEVPRIFVENEAGAYDATRHLIAHKHRDIAYLHGPAGLYSVVERQAGFRIAMAEAGITVRDEFVRGVGFSADLAREAVLEMLDLPSPPTAIFASSDHLGIGALRALKQRGVPVPEKMSLIVFDDMPNCDLFDPPLTVVRQPIEILGRRAFQALLALLKGRDPAMLTRLPVELVRRNSVASPRNGAL